MSEEQPRIVAPKERNKKSGIPLVVGTLNLGVGLLLMAIAALGGFMLAMTQLVTPALQTVHDQMIVDQRTKVERLEKDLENAISEEEKASIEDELESERKTLESLESSGGPQSLAEGVDPATARSYLPFTTVSVASLMVLGVLLFLFALGLIFRFRWSRGGFFAICLLLLLWFAVVNGAFLWKYNRMAATMFSWANDPSGLPSAAVNLEEIRKASIEIQRRNLIILELGALVFGLGYFGAMVFLVNRLEVKQDFRRKLEKDSMEWENMPEGGRIRREDL
jgi:hypothetical protein